MEDNTPQNVARLPMGNEDILYFVSSIPDPADKYGKICVANVIGTAPTGNLEEKVSPIQEDKKPEVIDVLGRRILMYGVTKFEIKFE